ncbi:MarR family winged helix-turn-helix transcriptional regulator [Streptacidiphilus cavernicola]|uniref:MarR family winged helix-turn-helix transcriptional regulator n=1 Tax=Streptacidiphilus cavernicola TaxID=3342716 RepID=A0ABV6VRD7_9ACTN
MKGPGSSDALVDELFVTTTRLRTYVDARLRVHGASVARLRALRMLAAAPEPLRMRDLGEMLGIAARTTTSVVDGLERDGLVERVRHPVDRRAFLVALTESGRARHLDAEAVDRDALAVATGGLDADDRARLRELLALIRETIDAQGV